MIRCHGTTNCGKTCKRKRETDFCKTHEYQNENCSICLNYIRRKVLLDCEHSFCEKCIYKWMCTKPSCPMCRKNITNQHLNDSIKFGVKNKLIVIVEENFISISDLSIEDQEFISLFGININEFMGEEEWIETIEYIDKSIKFDIKTHTCILRIQTPEQWEYYTKFNKIYLFN